jgi:hypothetical protein
LGQLQGPASRDIPSLFVVPAKARGSGKVGCDTLALVPAFTRKRERRNKTLSGAILIEKKAQELNARKDLVKN